MPAPKGTRPPAAGIGRKKGVPNKVNASTREALALFVEGNQSRLQGWLDEIAAAEGPRAAFECFMSVLEYHMPKMARIQVTGDGGGPIIIVASATDAAL